MYDVFSTCPSALEPLEPRFLLCGAHLEAAPVQGPPPPEPVLPAVEQESVGGPSNNDLASAESLRFAWMLPYPSYQDGFGNQVAVVEGQADGVGGDPFAQTGCVFGRLIGNSTFSVTYTDVPAPAGEGSLTFTANADLAGPTKYLALWLEGTLLGNLFETGGVTGTNITQVSIAAGVLSAAAADGVLEFTVQASAAVTPLKTPAFPSITMELSYGTAGGGADFYRIDLRAGQAASLSLTGAAPSLAVELVGTDGTVLSSGTAMDGQATIAGFQAAQAGTYYARVVGEGAYSLRVERGSLGPSSESGDSLRDRLWDRGPKCANWKWAVGKLTAGDRDYYELSVQKSALLSVEAFHFGTPRGAMKLSLKLYDAEGTLVASSRGPHLMYKAAQAGTYYLEVSRLDGSAGDYTIGIFNSKAKGK